jgi:hypothetical protein
MAARGWMSRAAMSDPHALRVPCTVILRISALLMCRSNSVKVGCSFGVPCRGLNARPVSTQPSPECSPSVSCSCLRSLGTATQGQGQGRGSGASDPSVLARPSQELAADPRGLLVDAQPRVHPRPGRLPHPHADRVTQPIFEARKSAKP